MAPAELAVMIPHENQQRIFIIMGHKISAADFLASMIMVERFCINNEIKSQLHSMMLIEIQ